MDKKYIEKYLNKWGLFIFAIITFLIMLNRVPFWDETHAFNIARLNLSQIFFLTRIEGHPILWFLIVKPFSSYNLYPWSIWLLNWGFCLGALFVLWKKSPFSVYFKTLITFSAPFLFYFAPVARCYSIGILFLFLICVFYKERFKKPILFSILIVLCANTSVLATIGAFYIGLIYLFELFKESKKIFLKVSSIFTLGILFLISQFINLRKPDVILETSLNEVIKDLFIFDIKSVLFYILCLISLVSFLYFSFIAYKKSKKALFYLLATYLTLSFIFLKVYIGAYWNYYFYFIYLIIFAWIFNKEIFENKLSKILLGIILTLFIFPSSYFKRWENEFNLFFSIKPSCKTNN